jgi:uncharacterized PurR-regulated membrane protein YhhQ (DUF165 family)
MSPERLFAVFNVAVLPAWVLLLVAPGWIWTRRLVHAVWIPFLLTAVYVYALVAAGPPPEGAGFATLAEVMVLFSSPMAVLAGWVHYLAFDLFVGAWEARDAQRHGIGRGWMVLPLVSTLMAGPVGLSLYLGIRWARTRSTSLHEEPGGWA